MADHRRTVLRLCMAGAAPWLMAGTASANQAETLAERGEVLVERLCSRCHATGLTGESPFSPAPPLREIASAYNIDDLAEAFAEGIEVGHPAMPVFELAPEAINELLAYLKTLK